MTTLKHAYMDIKHESKHDYTHIHAYMDIKHESKNDYTHIHAYIEDEDIP